MLVASVADTVVAGMGHSRMQVPLDVVGQRCGGRTHARARAIVRLDLRLHPLVNHVSLSRNFDMHNLGTPMRMRLSCDAVVPEVLMRMRPSCFSAVPFSHF